ncbi:glycosyltransferase [Nonomuraea rubra]|uniref:glycosyltransferase n=1 Tax=Nonomuraea rubra TaxID=46180 RepID=UPI0031E5C8DD
MADLPGLDPALITVVIPVRDRPEALGRLLTCIGDRHHVIVVDDASRAPAAIAGVVLPPWCRARRAEAERGPRHRP